MRLDSFYLLGSLWGAVTNPPVCSLNSPPWLKSAYESTQSVGGRAPAGVIAFLQVNVVPMDTERVLSNHTVLVKAGRIVALGPASKVPVPAGAVQVDGRGKYLMPGLSDMHSHNFSPTETHEQLLYRLFAHLPNGVTSIMGPLVSPEEDEQMWRHFQTGEVLVPRLYLARKTLDIAKRSLTPDSMPAYAGAYKAAGYDYIGMPADDILKRNGVYQALQVAARRIGIPASSHTNQESFETMLAFGANGGSVEHLYAFRDTLGGPEQTVSDAEIQAVAVATKRAGTWITPTLDCVEQRGKPPVIAVARRLVKALQDAGVGLLLGSDADGAHGQSLSVIHEELAEMIRAKLSPYQALRTGTYNMAKFLDKLEETGTVAVGKRADLLLLSGNPLVDIRHAREPVGVMIGGRWLDRSELDERLLASPKLWFQIEVEGGIMPQLTRDQRAIGDLLIKFAELTDSYARTELVGHERMLHQMTDQLSAIRALLTPEQREAFDPKARVWMREHARLGYRMVVKGVASAP